MFRLRRHFQTLLALIALCAGLAANPSAPFAETSSDFVVSRGNEAIRIFSIQDRGQRYQSFHQYLDENFWLAGIGRFSLGRYWNLATSEQQARFLKLYENFMLATYAARASRIEGVTLRLDKVTQLSDDEVLVDTLVHVPQKGDKDYGMGFRVHNFKTGPKIVDLVINGLSLIVTQRSQFTSTLSQNENDFERFLTFLDERVKSMENSADAAESKGESAALFGVLN